MTDTMILAKCKKKSFILTKSIFRGDKNEEQIVLDAQEKLEGKDPNFKLKVGPSAYPFLTGIEDNNSLSLYSSEDMRLNFQERQQNEDLSELTIDDSTTAESSTNNHNHGNYRKKKSKKMSWEDTYAEYANETKYGALLLCVTMSNYRKWCKSRTCRKEVKAIPHGRLFAYIEGTIIDVNVHEKDYFAPSISEGTDGYMIFTYKGDYYHGGIRNSLRHGMGITTYANGNIYNGEYKNNRRNSSKSGAEEKEKKTKNIMTYTNGDVYEGDFRDDKKDGYGTYRYADDGNIYEGEWKDGKMNGFGMYTYVSSGDVYEGEWKDGYFHGKGKEVYSNGDIYEGEYKYDKKNGRGIYFYNEPDTKWCGDVYEGEYKDGRKNGWGTYRYANGNIYEGEYRKDKEEGRGMYRVNNAINENEDGDIYEGVWKAGNLHGKGRVIYNASHNGDIYEGDWYKNRKHGHGIYKYNLENKTYKGKFKNDKKHDRKGILYDTNTGKIIQKGEWRKGKYIE